MKRLSAVLVLSLFSVYCFAQTQTGNASYNSSKKGLTLSHPSMSFGTHVRITNLRNNREIIATVDGRIPASDPRIADISAEAGDAIGLPRSGLSEVRLEQLLPQPSAPSSSAARESPPPPVSAPVSPAEPAPASPPPPAPEPASQEPRVETIQIVSPAPAPPSTQYLVLPPAAQNCSASPLCLAVLILLIVAVLLLTAILVLICTHRVPWLPWYYPVWVRRHLRYLKKRRY
jgi:rare lipoprotein A